MPLGVLLGLCMAVSIGVGAALSVVGPTVPAIAARLHVRESDMGVVFAANFLVGALTTPLAGRLYDRLGPRTLFPCGLGALALGALGEATAPTLALMTLAAGVVGLGTGINTVVNNVTAGSLFPERRESALNLLNASFGAGAFAAPLLAGFALAQLHDYRPIYAALAALVLLPAPFLVAWAPRHRYTGPARKGENGIARIMGERAFWAHAAISFLYLGSEIGFGGWIVVVLRHTTGLPAASAAPVAAVYWLFLALGGAPTALLLRRGVLPGRLVALGAAGSAFGAAVLIAFGSSVPIDVFAAAFVGLSLAPILPLNIAGALRLVGARTPYAVGAAASLVLMIGQLGAAALPALQGLLLPVGTGAVIAVTCGSGLAILAIQGLLNASRVP